MEGIDCSRLVKKINVQLLISNMCGMKKNSMDFEDLKDPDYNLFAPLEEVEEGPQAGFTMFEDDMIGLVDLTEDDLWSY